MDVIMLAAGLSSRMGKTNKMLLPYCKTTLAAHCSLQALEYLSKKAEPCRLIIVTGYQRRSLEKALKPCRDFIEKTPAPLELIIVNNPDYRNGQFSSAKTGISQICDGENFFVSLADMPKICPKHYELLEKELNEYDAVRPFFKDIPGHPVLFSGRMKNTILKSDKQQNISQILTSCNVKNIQLEIDDVICDIDTESDWLYNFSHA